MQEVIKEYLEHMKIGRKQACKNMALFPQPRSNPMPFLISTA